MESHVVRGLLCLFFVCGAHAMASERIRIGAEDDWSPYSSSVKGKPQGFAVDLVRAAWAAAGVEVELVPLPYARCMKEVDRGDLAGCFNTLRDPVQESRYRWHQQALFQARIGIYGRVTPGVVPKPLGLEGLRGKRIGTTHGYDYGAAFDGDPTMLRDEAPSDLSSLRKLVAGRVDYALVFDRVANAIAKSHPDLGKGFALHGVLVAPQLYLSFSPKYPDIDRMVSLFDQGLAKVRKSGEYARIEAKWR
ncbi:transporter substrate-binding domain-containing protein [Rhodoferax sp. AJA081-3]|uniref:substrate-binding periplasmic protein n=1 Tax=Rhodoferax sp. AJA081-3 TaxID=2752316 RepID=UPI001AE0889D|nr:transporter substrate-binding domain-containing protein [Rhodoferax sp. AJA081-3]QTN26938.1 transporter substrate-binding domain-containing protein [Rhodoferax sp. AJA081-3]